MEYNTASPIYLQVINDLKKKMIKGEFEPGEKMPASRELAVMYKINQNTAARIYREMEWAGYCFTRRGIGTFVTEEKEILKEMKREMAQELLDGFMSEMQDLGFDVADIVDQIQNYKEEGKR